MTTPNVVEIEVDGPHNEALHFRPLRRSVRGRFEWSRLGEPQARIQAATEPPVIPGQRIGFDAAAGKLYVLDGLHEPEHAAIRERIEAKGYRLPPAREDFECDAPTALYWMQRAVASGVAKLVKGAFPEAFGGEPRKDFILKREPSQTDRLTAAIERQCAAIERQSELMAKLLARLAK